VETARAEGAETRRKAEERAVQLAEMEAKRAHLESVAKVHREEAQMYREQCERMSLEVNAAKLAEQRAKMDKA
jgi:hypothetical protein